MFDDLITQLPPPPNRVGKHSGEGELHLKEGAVMLAFAMHLLRTIPGLQRVNIHPDGLHGQGFDMQGWLERRGFALTEPLGKTSYGGTYVSPTSQTIFVQPKSGLGDVVARFNGSSIVAECKGGVINTKHAGQQSRLRRGLCEAIGLLMASTERVRQFAVVPHTSVTRKLADKMAHRARLAGIEIALVDASGNVFDVKPPIVYAGGHA
jgi:hypothetical protein